jgi:hypothetical protein
MLQVIDRAERALCRKVVDEVRITLAVLREFRGT